MYHARPYCCDGCDKGIGAEHGLCPKCRKIFDEDAKPERLPVRHDYPPEYRLGIDAHVGPAYFTTLPIDHKSKGRGE